MNRTRLRAKKHNTNLPNGKGALEDSIYTTTLPLLSKSIQTISPLGFLSSGFSSGPRRVHGPAGAVPLPESLGFDYFHASAEHRYTEVVGMIGRSTGVRKKFGP